MIVLNVTQPYCFLLNAVYMYNYIAIVLHFLPLPKHAPVVPARRM